MSVSRRICDVLMLTSVVAFSLVTVTAQQPAEPSDEPFKIQVDTDRVLIPVVVSDRQGRAILDLNKQDFRVFDNGKLRTISAFMIEKLSVPVPQSNLDRNKQSSASPAPRPLAVPKRFIVFLFDDMHLTFEDMAHAEKAGAKVLAGTLVDSDIAAVVSISGQTNSGLTNDRAKLLSAIGTLKPRDVLRATAADCPNIEYYQADLIQNKHDQVALGAAVQQVLNCAPKTPQDLAERMAEMAAMRTLNRGVLDIQTTFGTISEILRRMKDLPGQRTLIFVSPGFLTITPEALSMESHLIDLAAQSNVTISALDARGLYTTELSASERSPGSGQMVQIYSDYRRSSWTMAENVMAELADGTGGTYFHNSNDLDAGFRRLTEAPECIYMLELSLDGAKHNGSYHRLSVKVNRDGSQLTARHGYFEPKPEKHKK